jgi:hypothetical protein
MGVPVTTRGRDLQQGQNDFATTHIFLPPITHTIPTNIDPDLLGVKSSQLLTTILSKKRIHTLEKEDARSVVGLCIQNFANW